jgi:succinate-semialdehyde dehydrogenase/glutarate-semialdehyde dehydrogenase
MKAAKMGDPTNEEVYYGPMARLDLRDELHGQVLKTVEQGGRLVLGGIILRARRLYPATILVDLEPGMEAFDNELFGPAASVMRAKDDAHC